MSAPERPGAAPPWHRQPGEPARWYARFLAYLALGPERSVLRLYRAEAEQAEEGRNRLAKACAARAVPAAWQRAAVRWQWRPRAAAFDAQLLAEALAAVEHERRAAAIAAARTRWQLLAQLGEALRGALAATAGQPLAAQDACALALQLVAQLRAEEQWCGWPAPAAGPGPSRGADGPVAVQHLTLGPPPGGGGPDRSGTVRNGPEPGARA